MNHMKRIILGLLICFTSLSIVACSGGGKESDNNADASVKIGMTVQSLSNLLDRWRWFRGSQRSG